MKERNEIMRFFGLHPQNDVRRKFAFTLAEVLITLGIIGVVAALTIPTLINNYQTKSWNTAAKVFEAKFTEALKTMNVQGKLGNYGKYDSTEGFVEELQKHFKTTKVCDRDHLMQCFEKTTTWGDKEADLSNIKESKDFVQLANGEEDWGTNVMGVQFANGVTGLIAYNPKCKSDPHDNRINGSNCYALLYDTSGFSEPNELGKDLRSTANVRNLSDSRCFAEVNGVCLTKAPQIPTAHVWNACDADGNTTDAEDLAFMSKYEINKCMAKKYGVGTSDYWAGAAELCGGTSKMASLEDLGKVATYVYNQDSIGTEQSMYDISLDPTKASELGLPSSGFRLWVGDRYDKDGASVRFFVSTGTAWSSHGRGYTVPLAVCVAD